MSDQSNPNDIIPSPDKPEALDPSAPLTTPYIGAVWELYEGHTKTWLSDIYEEITHRLLGPLEIMESELLDALAAIGNEPDLEKRKRLHVNLSDQIGSVRYAMRRVLFHISTTTSKVVAAELIAAPDIMEHYTTRILAEMGAATNAEADAYLKRELGTTVEDVCKVLPELGDDWYTRAGAYRAAISVLANTPEL